jgi:hypothetical protein
VISAASSREITLFVVNVTHRKNIDKIFLQNEANIAALREMHDKASYQLNCAGETSNA